MGLARLILLALCGWADGPDPTALIVDLSSSREAVRVEAAGMLEELGRPALPALYRARESDDPALRRQVEQLIDLVERQRLLRATRIRLDFDDMPLPEVAEALRAQTGFPVVIGPDDALRARRVTLHAPGPVPFWEALDRLGAACGVRHHPGVPFSPYPREPAVVLVPAEGPPPPASDDGPFRVHLVRLARHRQITPVRPPADATCRESLSADLQVFAEPGLAVNPIGPVVLQEVVDDRGRDNRPDPPVGRAPDRPWPPRFEEGHAGLFSLSVPLNSAAEPGGRLRRLKGFVPISVLARAGDPIVVPLADAEGKTFSKGGIALSVASVSRVGENVTFPLTIRGEWADQRFSPDRSIPLGEYRPPYRVEDHVQIQDDQGQALWWDAGSPRSPEGGGLEVVVTVFGGRGGPPARVLYHNVVGATTQLVFEFTDLPLP
jgi:hypothetical protein